MNLSVKDVKILRDLAKKVADIANMPAQETKRQQWFSHNSLQRIKPMVLIFPEGAWGEMLDDSNLETGDSFCRDYEWELRRIIYQWEHLQDDNVVEPVIICPLVIEDTGWGVGQHQIRPEDLKGASHYETVIKEESDIDNIRMPHVKVDQQASERNFQKALEIFEDILAVKQSGPSHFWFAVMDDFATLRGFDNLFLDLLDRPQWVHKVMDKMTQGYLNRLDQLESQNALSLNNRNHYVGSGGVGYTHELPQPDFEPDHVRPMDMWGFATTQIFSEVSPAMHEEFTLPYERRFLERFGLNCYGCCEPLHDKLDMVKTIPRLRRVSMSPWVDVEKGAKGLGDKYIFSYKPNPNLIATGSWDPDRAYRHLRDFLEKTKGCVVEIIMKDTHTCRNEPARMWEWVKIAKEVAEEFA